ncbi:MAG: solute-binding protein [Deltaproteobacteria bacterium]|nr:solute-binding protein [Deltaproteobacteria bacterium]
MTLHIGRIDYLNIWHVFHLLESFCPEGPAFHYIPGHPSDLNAALADGTLDISPSSAFEYLARAEHYSLLPGASICAHEEVQSVLFLSPVDIDELPAWLAANPGPVCVTGASATSTALLKVLWSQKWSLPAPEWKEVPPGAGLATGRPFLEIGNLALRHFVHPPQGMHVIDLAREWRSWTDLPFVFAVWIVRRHLAPESRQLVDRLRGHIAAITATLDQEFDRLSLLPHRPDWLTQPDLLRYWRAMDYGLDARERAALALFAECCTRQGLLPGAPGLRWFSI